VDQSEKEITTIIQTFKSLHFESIEKETCETIEKGDTRNKKKKLAKWKRKESNRSKSIREAEKACRLSKCQSQKERESDEYFSKLYRNEKEENLTINQWNENGWNALNKNVGSRKFGRNGARSQILEMNNSIEFEIEQKKRIGGLILENEGEISSLRIYRTQTCA